MGFCLQFILLLLANVAKPERRHEQRVNLKFLTKAGYRPVECWRHLRQVFQDAVMSLTQVRVWHRRFKAGEELTKDRPKTGHPHTQRTRPKIETIRRLVQTDNRRSVRGLSTASGINRGSVWTILKKDLQLRRRSARMIPHLLTQEQKDFHRRLCEGNLVAMRQDPGQFLASIITTDKTWIVTFELETKCQSAAWILPDQDVPQKARHLRSQTKTMMTVFFDFQGIIHTEFLPRGERICVEEYCETLGHLKEAVRRRRPHLWQRNAEGYRSFLLHQDNAPSHTAVYTLAKFGEWGIDLLAHPPLLPRFGPL